MYVVDFETEAIEARPHYPPVPVGVSIRKPGQKQMKYFAFGHPSANNCTKDVAHRALREAWGSSKGLLFQNAKFDIEVAEVHFGLSVPTWERIHDTLYLIYLADPHAPTYSLKPSAERWLNLPAEEQEAVRQWLVEHKIVRANDKKWGAQIAKAPGDLVGKYANGDVLRTAQLFDLLHARICKDGMQAAYDREREVMPILLRNEQEGIRLDTDGLQKDLKKYQAAVRKAEKWIHTQLNRPELNLDSDAEVAAVLDDIGQVTEWATTPTGKRSTSKKTLTPDKFKDPQLAAALGYRNRLVTCIGTFMEPWLEFARKDGNIHTTWNQVRQDYGSGSAGARTGRMSSARPNFQNVPKTFDDKNDGYIHPAFLKVPELPLMRRYLLPDEGEVWGHRDFCFSDDTEILTEHGWMLFSALNGTERVAQWKHGLIDYILPLAHQKLRYSGEMVNIRGLNSCDLLVSPEHRCLILTGGEEKFVRADEYPLHNNTQQPVAGVALGGRPEIPAVLRLVVAIQADAHIRRNRKGELLNDCTFYLKKARKVERLVEILDALGISYRYTHITPSLPGYRRIAIKVPTYVWNYLEVCAVDCVRKNRHGEDTFRGIDHQKWFCRTLLELDLESRTTFLEELAWWDDTTIHSEEALKHWRYYNRVAENHSIVQELCVLSGIRSTHTGTYTGMSYKTVCMTGKYTVKRVVYNGLIYCVTTPASTVIVRRNGRVCVTGQCQQELRILSHFEDGVLQTAYRDDPDLDIHTHIQKTINNLSSLGVDRSAVKILVFGIIYGMGLGKLSISLGASVENAKRIKDALLTAIPGLKALAKDISARGRAGLSIRTWGGRSYFAEPARMVDGQKRTFEYKLLNYLIQGSAADCTKEAVINYDKNRNGSRLLAVVHDELNISVPTSLLTREMAALRESMEMVNFSVPMLSTGKTGTRWGKLKAYEELKFDLTTWRKTNAMA